MPAILTHDPIHCLVYGESGTKKSTFAATFPTPMLVFFFDPLGKDAPYLRTGTPTGLISSDYPGFSQQEVYQDDQLAIRLEYFLDPLPREPQAYQVFENRFFQIQHHVLNIRPLPGEPQWQTLVFDSATFMELSARKLAQHKLQKGSKEPRQWYAASTELLEENLMMAVGSLPLNIVTICHVDEDKDESWGGMIYNPAFPGKLKKKSSAAYAEFYHTFIKADAKGNPQYCLQTQGNRGFNAASQIQAPDNCAPEYQALWKA